MNKMTVEPENKAGVRLKTLREREGLTQSKLAEIIDRSVAQIRNYERGVTPLPQKVAFTISRRYGGIPEYWMGDTDCYTRQEFDIELDRIESEAMAEYHQQEQMGIVRCEAFFSLCGFGYKDMDGDPVYVAQSFGFDLEGYGDVYIDQHKVFDINHPEETAYFSQDELDAILEKVHDLIAFECWKKQQVIKLQDKTASNAASTESGL